MDLSRFDSMKRAEEGVDLVLLDPVNKADSGAAITLYGADSSHQKGVRKEIEARNRALNRPLSSDELEANVLEILARCTKGWHGLAQGGKEIVFSQDKAKELYRAYPEIREQVERFIFNRANFFGSASAS